VRPGILASPGFFEGFRERSFRIISGSISFNARPSKSNAGTLEYVGSPFGRDHGARDATDDKSYQRTKKCVWHGESSYFLPNRRNDGRFRARPAAITVFTTVPVEELSAAEVIPWIVAAVDAVDLIIG
jgi:hypothetical protein